MGKINLTYMSHANSIARFIKIMKQIDGKKSISDIANILNMSDRSARHYATFGKDLGYTNFEHGSNFYLTKEGTKLVNSSDQEIAENLFEKINNVTEINQVVNDPESLRKNLENKGIAKISAERFILGLASIAEQAKSTGTIIQAMNGELNTSGFNVNKIMNGYQKVNNKKVNPVRQWHCECGMVNAPAVKECDMCGEEKPAEQVVMTAA